MKPPLLVVVQHTHGLSRLSDDTLLFHGQHVDLEHLFGDHLAETLALFLRDS